jgi:hypothetical protein
MGIRVKAAIGAIVILASTSGISGAMASPKKVDPDSLPLSSPSIPKQVDKITDLNRYWVDDSLGGQAKFLFGVPTYDDVRATRSAKNLEKFYTETLRQQSDSPIVRTRDLESPFCESLQGTPACSVAAQAPAPAPAPQPFIPEPLPPAPAPVPALY